MFIDGAGPCLGQQLVRADTEQAQSGSGAHAWPIGRAGHPPLGAK